MSILDIKIPGAMFEPEQLRKLVKTRKEISTLTHIYYEVGQELEQCNFSKEAIEVGLNRVAGRYSKKQVYQAVRLAITGKFESPPLTACMELIGKQRCLARILGANWLADETYSFGEDF